MEPEQIGRLFEPYFTTKKATGTGLGLFITKKVIENHRGSIQLRSKVGEGTMVTVRLPVLKKADVVIA
jgi:signal transduction histidine kinase